MKPYTVIGLCALALASCTGNGNKNADTTAAISKDTMQAGQLDAPAQNMEYCFLRTEGTSNQDTTAVHLSTKGDKVTGEMQWIPKEKDARKGMLNGTISGNEIKAVWTFMQEGMKDSIAVDFELSAQQLLQKPFKVTADGRQVTDEAAAYSITYQIDNCTKFKSAAKPAL
ncbi:hypothetical protein GWR56_19390 [Mucilaginibacter sp. 14171R-50]|uniref:hypothetical protein n=1 Tax=Mucilaginibacter sp. 14171R-50 TaxID=2703789 RepID=UPI00138C1C51|nr:hypothetical protein [Mucilaginibacter sp. 14171R-50]QHS57603.1 hypothetical protein GWR56_19390 [Mucilaginibacter sp. 14171R-50]